MFQIFKKLFDYNLREVNRLEKKVAEINALEDKARLLKDDEFAAQTAQLKTQIASGGKTPDDILPWSFALVREAARRVLGERHYDVQLLAGIGLHEGKILEQKTGEGKNAFATTALYLNALTGKGAHLVTVNDYLARRDAGWMGAVFHKLGLTTAAIIADKSFIYDPAYSEKESYDPRLTHLKPVTRMEAYMADVVYGINSEFGFDYLRDNMAGSPRELVQRGFHFAVIDEADSVLIDEARTPHIISAPTRRIRQSTTVRRHRQAPQSGYGLQDRREIPHCQPDEEGVKHIEKVNVTKSTKRILTRFFTSRPRLKRKPFSRTIRNTS
jgi:preprotein translocase subunit SecA